MLWLRRNTSDDVRLRSAPVPGADRDASSGTNLTPRDMTCGLIVSVLYTGGGATAPFE